MSGRGLQPDAPIMRFADMKDAIETLRRRIKDAAAALDFEDAKRCRDMINMIRGGATVAEAESANFAGLDRQQPGAMGLGTSRQSTTPPAGWRAPPRPDLMTSGRSRGRRGKP